VTVDTRELRARVDLLDLAGGDTQLRKVASTRGGEFAGSCPFCGGRDRFRVQPDQGLWWCRQCSSGDRWEDAIAYVMRRDGSTFVEACTTLGATNDSPAPAPRLARARAPLPVDLEPTAEWRASALAVVEACEAVLWSDDGAQVRGYLHARGLTEETLRRWRVGFNSSERSLAGLWVFQGITLPWFVTGAVWQVKVRRGKGADPKYKSIAGGHPLLYGADTLAGHSVAILPEGEFDAMLLHQEVGDLVGVASLGNAQKQLSLGAVRYLLPIPTLLLSYDTDADGQRGSERLAALSARMRRVTVPSGKDVTEFWQQGGQVRAWVQYELARLRASAMPPGSQGSVTTLLSAVPDRPEPLAVVQPSAPVADPWAFQRRKTRCAWCIRPLSDAELGSEYCGDCVMALEFIPLDAPERASLVVEAGRGGLT
jgi:DNA primase